MKKICVMTGTRAEYGLLSPLMKMIKGDEDFVLQVIASGMHLSPEFGLTYKLIEEDGFFIDRKVELLLSSDTPVGVSKAIGLGVISFSEALEQLKPDLLVLLGDRFESLAAAIAAMVLQIPIAHLYGGEATYGLIDEPIRHSITKMSHLHFTATDEYRKKVIQLGEAPDRVYNVGAIGLDNIKQLKLLSKDELESELSLKFSQRNLLITFHPVTLESNTSEEQLDNLLEALDGLGDTTLIFTKSNADTFGRVINKRLEEFVSVRERAFLFNSLGQLRYLSTLQYIDAVVGNSSSGLIEAPSFKIGTINIGARQAGRIKAKSVIDSSPLEEDIRTALDKLYSNEFKEGLKEVVNPYGDGETTERIFTVFKSVNPADLKYKEFYRLT